MITASEIQETLRDLLAHYGPPSDSNSQMYSSVLKRTLANDPREAGLLELSIDQKIPTRLYAQKENPQIIDQLVQELIVNQRINSHAAEWIVKTWAKSMGLNVASCQPLVQQETPNPSNFNNQQQSYQPPVNAPPGVQGVSTPNIWNNPQQSYQYGEYINQPNNTSPPIMVDDQEKNKYCPGCGKTFPENANFCPFCSYQIKRDNEVEPNLVYGYQKVFIDNTNENARDNGIKKEDEKIYDNLRLSNFTSDIPTLVILLGSVICLYSLVFLPFESNLFLTTTLYSDFFIFLLYLFLIIWIYSGFYHKYSEIFHGLYTLIGAALILLTVYLGLFHYFSPSTPAIGFYTAFLGSALVLAGGYYYSLSCRKPGQKTFHLSTVKDYVNSHNSNTIEEYRRTCKNCGTVWHSLKSRETRILIENTVEGLGITLKASIPCVNCCMYFGGRLDNSRGRANNNELVRLKTCPKCGSAVYTEEILSHEK